MEITAEVVGLAAFGNLSAEDMAIVTDDEHLILTGNMLRELITDLQKQIEDFNRRNRGKQVSESSADWYRRTATLKGRCEMLWAQHQRRYRLLRQQINSGGPGYRRAIEEHRVTVLREYEPSDADERLWKVLDSYPHAL